MLSGVCDKKAFSSDTDEREESVLRDAAVASCMNVGCCAESWLDATGVRSSVIGTRGATPAR